MVFLFALVLQYAGLNWPEIYRSYFCSTCTILESRLVSLCYRLNNKEDPMQCSVLKLTLHFLALFVLDLKKELQQLVLISVLF